MIAPNSGQPHSTFSHQMAKVHMAIGRKKPWKLNYSRATLFQKFKVPAKKDVFSFVASAECVLPAGWSMNAAHFVAGQHIDVKGVSIGKGFQGVMKRWGFAGQPATHGTSLKHRSPGSIGTKGRGRVMKGKKMAGKMGNEPVIVYNLQVLKVDTSVNCLFVKGHVPGHRCGTVWIRDSEGQRGFTEATPPPTPTFVPQEAVARFLEVGCAEEGKEKDPLERLVSEKK